MDNTLNASTAMNAIVPSFNYAHWHRGIEITLRPMRLLRTADVPDFLGDLSTDREVINSIFVENVKHNFLTVNI